MVMEMNGILLFFMTEEKMEEQEGLEEAFGRKCDAWDADSADVETTQYSRSRIES